MNKKEARAVIALHRAILDAVEKFEQKLAGNSELEWYRAYPLAQLRATANGTCYAGLPIGRAEEALD